MVPPHHHASRSAATIRLEVRTLDALATSSRDAQAWAALEARALEPNAYLSPHHVLPAARHLDPHSPPLIFAVERHGAGASTLIGIGVFAKRYGTRSMPLPHLVGYRSRHTFLSGLLLDREHAEDALHALLGHVRSALPRCAGIVVPHAWADGALAQAARQLNPYAGIVSVEPAHHERAVLVPAEAGTPLLERTLGKRLKGLERRMRRLRERGEVGWRCHRDGPIPPASVDAFLALEHAGWKGEGGSSLRSRPADEAFFRETLAGFGAEGRAVFTELTLDDRPIACVSHFISGRRGFGFKLGWDPAFKAYSPGILNEIEFIRHAPQAFADIELFDSGAVPSSFINGLWSGRRSLSSVTLPTHPIGQVAARSRVAVQTLRRKIDVGSAQVASLLAARHDMISVASAGMSDLLVGVV